MNNSGGPLMVGDEAREDDGAHLSPSERLHKKLQKLDCIGFDMDHTLVRYNLDNLHRLNYSCFANHLVNEEGFGSSLKEFDLEQCRPYIHKGVVLDKALGNVVKLDVDKRVIQGHHGTKRLSDEDVKAQYPTPLVEFDGAHSSRYFALVTYFEMSIAPLWMKLVDEVDSKPIEDPEEPYVELFPAIVRTLRASFADWNSGGFFEALRERTGDYVLKANPKLISWLQKLKARGVRLFMATNSGPEYTHLLMSYCFGENFHDLFDVVIVNAMKPYFFTDTVKDLYPLHTYFPDALSSKAVQEGTKPLLYKEGNVRHLLNLLEQCFNKEKKADSLRICYMGDHLMGDVVVPKKEMKWLTVAILEELEDPDELIFFDKKTTQTTDKENVWGSFFFIPTHQHQPHSEPVDTAHKYSFWSELIRNHADICVPSVDAFAEFFDEPAEHHSISTCVVYNINKTNDCVTTKEK
eukprot:TRINITY_DN2055_c0_g1_i2.p1 TRINITY_DN2055_c0_g1~~TRINITY_DN2055_c0_g1_i2.p1  ORF type:complete len:464 (-),score=100.35 TRINITY_DN2055_c0_g1_i2:896-2287(-)